MTLHGARLSRSHVSAIQRQYKSCSRARVYGIVERIFVGFFLLCMLLLCMFLMCVSFVCVYSLCAALVAQ